MHVTISDDLAVAIGDRSVQVSPSEAFRLAERLIRRATVRMMVEEAGCASADPATGMPPEQRPEQDPNTPPKPDASNARRPQHVGPASRISSATGRVTTR